MTSLNSFSYLIKTKLENKEDKLLEKQEYLEKEYENKICNFCIGANQQAEKSCSLLKGGKLACCKNMENYVHKRLKKEKGELFKKIVASQVEKDDEVIYQIVDVD